MNFEYDETSFFCSICAEPIEANGWCPDCLAALESGDLAQGTCELHRFIDSPKESSS